MPAQRYSVNPHLVETILTWVKSGEIAIPEIQRPFVWNSTQVRDLIDSLYHGYPVGYIISWQNPNVKLKDGTTSLGKKILIDGQQRVMALKAALLGEQLLNDEYKKIKIRIAFNPQNEKFEVCNPAIEKDDAWIKDISPLFTGEEGIMRTVKKYVAKNQNYKEEDLENRFEMLKQIIHKQIGVIELNHDLDIDEVTDIFIRVNSKGVALSQADFAMSKIAVNEKYDGPKIRKCIDYFCHLLVAPEFFSQISTTDKEFVKSTYFKQMSWLKKASDDIYVPDYKDLLAVSFMSEFNRGKLADLVNLLSGRNFETRTYEEEIAKKSFAQLEAGMTNFINETNFKRFLMIIRSAGFISTDLIRSKAPLNFAYVLYLRLRAQNVDSGLIEKYVRKWFVLSVLTGRYSASPESMFDYDVKQIATNKNFREYLEATENAELGDAFWDVGLVQNLETSVITNPSFNTFLAAQAKGNDKGFLSRTITVNEMIAHRGDIHHLFPREYLKNEKRTQGQYNQVANYAYAQAEINIKIGKKPPAVYFKEILEQCNGKELKYGDITNENELYANLDVNCIPHTIVSMDATDYEKFLKERRILMAKKIKQYYQTL